MGTEPEAPNRVARKKKGGMAPEGSKYPVFKVSDPPRKNRRMLVRSSNLESLVLPSFSIKKCICMYIIYIYIHVCVYV